MIFALEERLLRYSRMRYARCAFVYTFSYQWMLDEQSVRTPADLAAMRLELAMNASARIAASDRILDSAVVSSIIPVGLRRVTRAGRR